jgi:hypothetical protein
MGEHRTPGGGGKPRVEPDIDRAHNILDPLVAGGEPREDRVAALVAMGDEGADVSVRVADRAAMCRAIERLAAP